MENSVYARIGVAECTFLLSTGLGNVEEGECKHEIKRELVARLRQVSWIKGPRCGHCMDMRIDRLDSGARISTLSVYMRLRPGTSVIASPFGNKIHDSRDDAYRRLLFANTGY